MHCLHSRAALRRHTDEEEDTCTRHTNEEEDTCIVCIHVLL